MYVSVKKTILYHSSTSILLVSFYLHLLSLVITFIVYIREKAPQCLQAYTGHMDQDNNYEIHQITKLIKQYISLLVSFSLLHGFQKFGEGSTYVNLLSIVNSLLPIVFAQHVHIQHLFFK